MPKATSLLLADAGATHTRVIVAAANGKILGRSQGGPANPFAVGQRVASENLLDAVRQALRSACVPRSSIAVVVVGSAGVDYDGAGGRAVETTLRRALPRAKVRAVADALIALEGALGDNPGVVILSGTGSVVLGRNRAGRICKVGGWGPLLGDEGSAAWIARQALQFATRAADGTGPPTLLVEQFRRHFHLRSFRQIIEILYGRHWSPADLGALAGLVTQAGRRGDRAARQIFLLAGEALAGQAVVAVRRLRLRAPMVSYQGSVFRSGGLLEAPLRAALRRHVPNVQWVRPKLPPIGGAMILALRELALPVNAEALRAFREQVHA